MLADSAAEIDGCEALAGYVKALITDAGPQPSPTLYGDAEHRDWLLTWPGPSADRAAAP